MSGYRMSVIEYISKQLVYTSQSFLIHLVGPSAFLPIIYPSHKNCYLWRVSLCVKWHLHTPLQNIVKQCLNSVIVFKLWLDQIQCSIKLTCISEAIHRHGRLKPLWLWHKLLGQLDRTCYWNLLLSTRNQHNTVWKTPFTNCGY